MLRTASKYSGIGLVDISAKHPVARMVGLAQPIALCDELP